MIRLTEYENATVRLAPDEVLALLPLVRGGAEDRDDDARVLQSLTPTGTPGVFQVRAGPYVGRLGLPSGRWIDFVSRFPIDDVFQMVIEAHQLPVRVSDLQVPTSVGNFFVDLLAAAFLGEVERLVMVGLAKEYRVRRHLAPPYAGHLDAAYHVSRLGGRPDALATVSRKLTTDVAVNALLATALDRLRHIALAPPLRRRTVAVMPPFARVARPLREPRVIDDTVRSAARPYRSAAALAALIVRTQALVPTGATHVGGSMLFYMPPVWESFVGRWVQRERPDCRVQIHYRFTLGSDGTQADADVVAWDVHGGLVGIYDAKYKWARTAPRAGDLYQMVTYCTALGVTEATLVYPVAAGPRSIRVGDVTVRVVGAPPLRDTPVARRDTWHLLRVRPSSMP